MSLSPITLAAFRCSILSADSERILTTSCVSRLEKSSPLSSGREKFVFTFTSAVSIFPSGFSTCSCELETKNAIDPIAIRPIVTIILYLNFLFISNLFVILIRFSICVRASLRTLWDSFTRSSSITGKISLLYPLSNLSITTFLIACRVFTPFSL